MEWSEVIYIMKYTPLKMHVHFLSPLERGPQGRVH